MTDELVQAELRLRLAAARERGLSFDLAVWQLLCGEPDAGLATLRARDPEPGPPALSVVAGDWERAAGEARASLAEPAERLVAGYRHYVRALHALIAGLEDEAARQVDDLRAYVADHEKLRSGHPRAVAGIAGGLLERAAGDVETGLDALLAWHLRRARARSEIFNSARGVISLEAVAVLLLAHRRGLDVAVDDRYRRVSVPLLALHLVEWQGRPLPQGLGLARETDLVAGAWLRAHGLDLGEPHARPRQQAGARRPRRLPSVADGEAARAALRERTRAGGSPWQLASWSLMLGEPEAARAHLTAAAAEASRQPANPNTAREHFALALVLGAESDLHRTSAVLREWDSTPGAGTPYAHASGYLDLIRHLLEPGRARPTRADAERVFGGRPSLRIACIGLVEHDAATLTEGLGAMLREHAATLERRTSPPPPVSEPAVHVAVAARRIGLAAELDDASRRYDVPVRLPDGRFARLPCDLLGTKLWSRR